VPEIPDFQGRLSILLQDIQSNSGLRRSLSLSSLVLLLTLRILVDILFAKPQFLRYGPNLEAPNLLSRARGPLATSGAVTH
jgi:hypothetical protein